MDAIFWGCKITYDLTSRPRYWSYFKYGFNIWMLFFWGCKITYNLISTPRYWSYFKDGFNFGMLFLQDIKWHMILFQDLDLFIHLISSMDLIFWMLFFEDIKLHVILFQDLDIHFISNMDLVFRCFFWGCKFTYNLISRRRYWSYVIYGFNFWMLLFQDVKWHIFDLILDSFFLRNENHQLVLSWMISVKQLYDKYCKQYFFNFSS